VVTYARAWLFPILA